MIRRWMAVAAACVTTACHPPRAPTGELIEFNPPLMQVLPAPRLRPPPAALVLAAPLTRGVTIVPLIGHESEVERIDIREDEEVAVTASRDGAVKVWDLHSGALLRTLVRGDRVAALAILPDGRRVLTAGVDGTLRIWALASGQRLRTFGRNDDAAVTIPISALAVSPNGRRAAVADDTEGGSLDIYDLDSGARLRSVATTSRVTALSFTVGGDEVVSGDTSGAVKRYDLEDLQLRRSIAGHAREVTALDVSQDGRRVLSASADGRLKLWDVASGALLRVVPAHALPVRGVAVSADAARAVSGSEDGTVKVWDLENKRVLRTLTGHHGAVTALAAARGDSGIVTGGEDGTVRLWNIAAGEAMVRIPAHDETAFRASLSGSGRSALTVSRTGDIRVWDLAGLAVSRRWAGGSDVTAASLSLDASQVVTAESDGRGSSRLRLWEVGAARPAHTFEVPSGMVTSATFSPRGMRALTGGMLGSVMLWGTAIRRPLRELVGHTSPVRSVAMTEDGRRALTAAIAPMVGPDRVKLWDLDAGTEIHSFDGYGAGTLRPDGDKAFVGARDGSLAVLDLDQRKVERSWAGHEAAIAAVATDRRGRVLASADQRGVIKIWDDSRERLVRTLEGHGGAVHTLRISADAERVMSASTDGSLRVWRIATGASVSFIARGAEWLAFSDDGYFAASPRGAELAYAVSGLQGFRLDQLTAHHNRPDMLLERLGGGEKALMDDFAARHKRRLAGMGVTELGLAQSFSAVPRVALTEVRQDGDVMTLGFQVASPGVPADYQIRVNGVPWFAAAKRATTGTLEEEVVLGAGRNRIAIEVTDAAGASAIPATHLMQNDRPARPTKFHYVGIGVSRYRSAGLGLKYAARDAVELGRAFTSAEGAFDDVIVHTLVDEQATAAAIHGLSERLANVALEDTVVLFVAGHWAHTRSSPADPLFVPHDAEPARLDETGLRLAQLVRLVRGVRARRRLVIVDGCMSGDRDEDVRRRALGEATRRGLLPRTSGALLPPPDVAPRTFLFQDDRLIMEAEANDAGAVLLRASRGSELCYESDDSNSGALTAALLRAMRTSDADTDGDGWIDLEELGDYVEPAVASRTGDLQHPRLLRGRVEQEIRLPRVTDLVPVSKHVDHPLVTRSPPGCGCEVAGGERQLPRWWPFALLLAARRRRR